MDLLFGGCGNSSGLRQWFSALAAWGNEIKEASIRDIWPLRVFRCHPLPPHLPTFGQAGKKAEGPSSLGTVGSSNPGPRAGTPTCCLPLPEPPPSPPQAPGLACSQPDLPEVLGCEQ